MQLPAQPTPLLLDSADQLFAGALNLLPTGAWRASPRRLATRGCPADAGRRGVRLSPRWATISRPTRSPPCRSSTMTSFRPPGRAGAMLDRLGKVTAHVQREGHVGALIELGNRFGQRGLQLPREPSWCPAVARPDQGGIRLCPAPNSHRPTWRCSQSRSGAKTTATAATAATRPKPRRQSGWVGDRRRRRQRRTAGRGGGQQRIDKRAADEHLDVE